MGPKSLLQSPGCRVLEEQKRNDVLTLMLLWVLKEDTSFSCRIGSCGKRSLLLSDLFMHKISGESPATTRPRTCLILSRTWRESKRKKKGKPILQEKSVGKDKRKTTKIKNLMVMRCIDVSHLRVTCEVQKSSIFARAGGGNSDIYCDRAGTITSQNGRKKNFFFFFYVDGSCRF